MYRAHRPLRLLALTLTLALVTLVSAPLTAHGAPALLQISQDPFINAQSQHQTEVEPDIHAAGSTLVAAFQTGRIYNGGSADIGWATSVDGGTTWTHGFLPGTTTVVGGPEQAVSDPAVAYDAAHKVWLIASLPLTSAVIASTVSRSTDGGLTWGNPVVVGRQTGSDKTWVTCDDTPTSPFYGHCYVEWDDNGLGNVIFMSTSTDGGLTWGTALPTANVATGLGGQPLVAPNGAVIVPINNANGTSIMVFFSTNGGASWSRAYTTATIKIAPDPGQIRAGSLPTAAIDAAGKVYIVWEDCRFEPGCTANDLVMQTVGGGAGVSAVTRIPIDAVGSNVDHLVPGLGADPTTSGGTAHLGLSYYYFPNAQCTVATCQLNVGFVSSLNGGSTWSTPTQLAGPMQTPWLAKTSQGYMVGDYMATTFASGRAYPVFAVAHAPTQTRLDEAMNTVAGGLAITGGALSSAADQPAPGSVQSSIQAPSWPLLRQ